MQLSPFGGVFDFVWFVENKEAVVISKTVM